MPMWDLFECGYKYDTIEADTAEKALEEAKTNVDRTNYPDCGGTLYVDVRVECKETDEEESDTVVLPPDEPDCTSDGEHDWQSPLRIVGGCKENPGVYGHGGGVVIHEVCMACGCARKTDTWAQNPTNGVQGLTDVSYEPGKYADDVG